MLGPIVDAHLDLADNVLGGRDYTLEVDESSLLVDPSSGQAA